MVNVVSVASVGRLLTEVVYEDEEMIEEYDDDAEESEERSSWAEEGTDIMMP